MTYALIQKPGSTFKRSINSYAYTFHYDCFVDPYTFGDIVLNNCGHVQGEYYNGTALKDMTATLLHAPGNNLWLYQIELAYETMTSQEREQLQVEPLDRSTIIEHLVREREEIMDEDMDGVAVLNGAKDPLSPALTRRAHAPVIRATKNYDYWDAGMTASIVDHTNADAFAGFSPGQLLCVDVQAQQTSETRGDVPITYYRVSFEFEADIVNSWKAQPLNVGFRAFQDNPAHDTDPDAPEEIVADIMVDEMRISEPVPLTEDGHILNDGMPPDEYVDPNYLEFVQYNSVSFSGLGL